MAFTPINSSGTINDDSDSPGIIAKAENTSVGHDMADHNIATTVASTYLGRGERTKKLTVKGKKRQAAANPPTKTKRRQTSDVNDTLRVSKFGDGEGIIQPDVFSSARVPALTSQPSKTKITASQLTSFAPSVSTAVSEPALSAVKTISVHSSNTTMKALDTTSMPTSVEIAKASDGQGFTLYQGPSSTASYTSSIPMSVHKVSSERRADSLANTTAAKESDDSGTSKRRSARLRKNTDFQAFSPQFEKFSQPSDRQCDFDDVDGETFSDIEVMDLTDSNECDIEIKPHTPPNRGRKLNTRDVDELEDYGGALLSDADKRALIKIDASADSQIKPIVRKPFPPSVLDRSPILGVSQGVVLRTCFRVGEAMASGCHGVRNGHDVVIEIHARVTASWREPAPGRKQHFTFKDIYHDNPPFLEGTFELWQQAKLWDLDSKVFLEASKGSGIMCRSIARMKRDGQKWRLDVLSVWEATWEDIHFAAGICTDAVGL